MIFYGSRWYGHEIKDHMEDRPRYDINGEQITNPCTYVVAEVLERFVWSFSRFQLKPDVLLNAKIQIEVKDLWFRATVELDGADELEE